MGSVAVTGTAAGTDPQARRRELGRCLRAYRALVTPEDVGLTTQGRRRAPGLRREEVAVLAGVGVTWYTWLEQGRVSASDQVIDAVGRVLGVDAVGREHLCSLSRPAVATGPTSDPGALRRLLDGWPSDPAALLDHRLDVVAVNDAWRAVWGDTAGRHVLEPLTAGPLTAHRDDLTPLVQALARRLRMATDRAPDDQRLVAIRDRLRDGESYGPLWDCRGVGAFGHPTVQLDGVERTAVLLGEAGAPDLAGPTVLVLLTGEG